LAFQKPTYNYAAAWTGIFLCTLLAQINLFSSPEEVPELSSSQMNLLQNAVIPIYLSENRSASIRQLENLIQETDIRQIHVYTSDQQLVAQVLNSSVPEDFRETRIENVPMVFQGTMAGSFQIDIAYAATEPKIAEQTWGIILKSVLITAIAWVLTCCYLLTLKWLLPKLYTRSRQPGILENTNTGKQVEQGSSLLTYIYPIPDQALSQDPKALKECLTSFSRKLESHLRIYGGRILSFSDERLICRMAAGQSQNDLQQALTFCWGVARPMIYRNDEHQFKLDVKSLLHKTETPAKSGDLYKALSEIDKNMEQTIIQNSQGAHITDKILLALDSSSNFDHIQSKEHSELHQILSVKKSVDALWQKQESMVSSTKL